MATAKVFCRFRPRAATDGLWAVPFDLDRLEVTGPALPVLEGLQVTGSGRGQFALGGDGSLVYVAGAGAAGAPRTLVCVDRQGREEPLLAAPQLYATPDVSPDGGRGAVIAASENWSIWIYNVARDTLTRLDSRVRVSRVRSQIQMSLSWSRAPRATLVPSGEMRGNV